jgi:serine/threonine-protein kinase
MEILCTRPGCSHPRNFFADLDEQAKIKTAQQKFCTSCGMPLILAGRYLPLSLLGKGGFGAAFLAIDRYTPTMRQCVVKLFQPGDNLTPQERNIAQNLFEREATVLEQLGDKHPQIPDLYAFFPLIVPSSNGTQEEQYFYLVQEFIDGQDLEGELIAKGKFSEAEVQEVLTEILKVLEFVHQHNSIHRDIKPSNIMRSHQGVLYLLDFGAVKQVTVNPGNLSLAKSTGIYSMGFAPPEQMTGGQVYPCTDLYALAATCITLLAGKPVEDLYNFYNHRWDWRNYAPQVSDRLATILDKMLLPAPVDRYQSATDVLAELNSLSMVNVPSRPSIPIRQTPQSPLQPSSQGKLSLSRSRFSLLEILASAAFTGFEGALLFIALVSWLSFSGLSIGIWGMALGGLIFAQTRRLIEKIDLGIIAGITVALVFFLPVLQGAFGIKLILIIATMSGAAAIAIMAIFRLLYQLFSRLL